MRILIAEDDPVSRRVLATTLIKWGHEVVVTHDGLQAWEALQEVDAPRLAIIDWMMPGIEGTEICRRIRRNPRTESTYVIMLTALRQKEEIIAGLEAGADDYLTKPFDRHELRVRLQAGARIVALQESLAQRVKELEAAVSERQRAEEALRNLTLTDDLTGLYNHRGFFTLAEHNLKNARRGQQSSSLFYADMDGLKEINDTFGHNEGSVAIATIGEVLRQTFRSSDIVARLGGDEFGIFALDASFDETKIIARLEENLRKANEKSGKGYRLSLSVGAVLIHPYNTLSLDKLIAMADKTMYEQKRRKKQQRRPLEVKLQTGSGVWSPGNRPERLAS